MTHVRIVSAKGTFLGTADVPSQWVSALEQGQALPLCQIKLPRLSSTHDFADTEPLSNYITRGALVPTYYEDFPTTDLVARLDGMSLTQFERHSEVQFTPSLQYLTSLMRDT